MYLLLDIKIHTHGHILHESVSLRNETYLGFDMQKMKLVSWAPWAIK